MTTVSEAAPPVLLDEGELKEEELPAPELEPPPEEDDEPPLLELLPPDEDEPPLPLDEDITAAGGGLSSLSPEQERVSAVASAKPAVSASL